MHIKLPKIDRMEYIYVFLYKCLAKFRMTMLICIIYCEKWNAVRYIQGEIDLICKTEGGDKRTHEEQKTS